MFVSGFESRTRTADAFHMVSEPLSIESASEGFESWMRTADKYGCWPTSFAFSFWPTIEYSYWPTVFAFFLWHTLIKSLTPLIHLLTLSVVGVWFSVNFITLRGFITAKSTWFGCECDCTWFGPESGFIEVITTDEGKILWHERIDFLVQLLLLLIFLFPYIPLQHHQRTSPSPQSLWTFNVIGSHHCIHNRSRDPYCE